MYATRSQAHAFDENKAKAAAAKAPAVAKAPEAVQGNNNRRALGDIGNLVGSLSTRCSVKDGPSENGARPNKAQPALVERPITRRFAQAHNLQIGKPNDEVIWGAKQRRTTVTAKPQQQQTDAGVVAEKKENVPALPAGHPARMKALLQKSGTRTVALKKEPTLTAQLTAWSEFACGGFDSEMTDAEEPLPNIDEADVGNHLAVVDYVEDIYSFYRKAEVQHAIPAEYMSQQTDLSHRMRAILVDWLIEVHLKFKLMPETLFLTVYVIDAYLSRQTVSRKYLQLVGVTAMLIAAKYEEIWAPSVKHFVKISDEAYTGDQIRNMEKKMLNTLNFNLTVPTPYVFVARFLKAASSNRQLEMLAFYLVELCLTEYATLKYRPSLLAAAAVYTAQCCLKKSPLWTTALQRHSGYTEKQVMECARCMVSYHKEAGHGSLKVVFKKYSHSKFESVASLPPAELPQID